MSSRLSQNGHQPGPFRRRVRGLPQLLLLLSLGCSAPVQDAKISEPRDVADTESYATPATEVAQLPEPGPMIDEPGFAGLDLLYPEIVELDEVYEETLQAIREDDLDTAESGIAWLDSALAEVNDTLNPLVSIFYQNLGGRVERLKEVVEEERDFLDYVARMDSLGVITAWGEVDSTALVALLEKPETELALEPRYDLELVDNPLVNRWVRYFTGDGRRYMQLWLERKPLYEETIFAILEQYNLPRDMIYLAMIESGLSMKARSYANAVGPWQFIASTGRLYGLKIDWWVDERRDLEKATHAAASHLSDLYESLNSWPLALSAYNAGIRRVERAVRRHKTRDFWQLSSLPRQTRNYVPKFMAALKIGNNAEVYGFHVPKRAKLEYDVVRVDDATDLNLIADLAGASLDSIIELNPHLKRWATPPGDAYEVKVPKGLGEITTAKLAKVPAEDRVAWRRHRVRRGESLSTIARRYGTSVTAIKQANKLRRNLIHSGTFLLIPVVSNAPSARAQKYIDHAAKTTPSGRSTYRVRRGDTLGKIARRHGVSVNQIMAWNGKSNTRITVGERLTLYGAKPSSITYVVRRGDTLSKIGKRHRVSVRQLMRWNKKRNTRIRVGERLRIYPPG
ncbi:MAG: LysM peptidoglycan-binding domain-containing protein [Candidatus Latescibacterota bacterium]|nr:MAG: LysM peptidoglycan-binding domain-containing protein [Candidatus Latescibacterota bacterium]